MRRVHTATPSPVRSSRSLADMACIAFQSRVSAIRLAVQMAHARLPWAVENLSQIRAVTARSLLERGEAAGLRVPFLNLGEEGLGEPNEVGFAHSDLVARLQLQHGLVRREREARDGGVRPPGEPVDLELALVEHDRVG